MTRIFRCAAATFVLLSLPLVPAALAEDYPNKPIRIIVGPGPDILSRIFGQKFTEAWGQQTVIDPRPGAGGTISAELAAKATPDGYTLLMATSAYTINAVLQPGAFDLVRDFAAIAWCATSPYILVVHLSVPARSVQELIALAVTSLQRSRLAPDLPTVAEAGLAGFEAIGWNGLTAPARTPKAIVAKLNGEVMRALKEPAILQRLADVGWEAVPENSPVWFADYIKRDIAKWAWVVKETGAKVD